MTILILFMVMMSNPEDAYAKGYTTRVSLSYNSLDQKSALFDYPEDVDEEDFEDDASSDSDDGQLLYMVCQLYDNMEVMLSGILKLQYIQIVLLTLLLGAFIGFGIIDHFVR